MATQHAVAVREQPLVSVAMVTYNHQSYIAQAIEGVLAQKTTFPIELIVSDDKSTDNTAQVIGNLEDDNREVIKPVYRKKNIGSMANFLDTLSRCKGKYIAFCDGDDYWTDPYKLQKQIDFLEENPGYVICAHQTELNEGDLMRSIPNPYLAKNGELSITDLAVGNLFYTSSVVYRNGMIGQFPDWMYRSPVGDYVLFMLNARKGKLKYLPDTMSVYRKHPGGIWHGAPMETVLERWLLVIDLLLTEDFEPPVKTILRQQRTDTVNVFLEFLLQHKPSEFSGKIMTIVGQDAELLRQWLNKLTSHSEAYFELKPRYDSLKNSRLRKYLSYLFPQLKM